MMLDPGTFVYSKSSRSLLPASQLSNILPVRRVGSDRTADGAAFVLSDESKVGKILYYESAEEKKEILREYEIGYKMGNANVGPKVYTYFTIKTAKPGIVNQNLLSNRTPGMKAIFIVMENLMHNAVKLQSLSDYVKDGNPYPYQKVMRLKALLAKHKILHGDLHSQNIMVKTKRDGSFRVYFIDFGRSIYIPPGIKNVKSYLTVSGYKRVNGYRGYYTSPSGVPRGLNENILTRNMRLLGGSRPKRTKVPAPNFVTIEQLFKKMSPRNSIKKSP
jgi:hypothetical protein